MTTDPTTDPERELLERDVRIIRRNVAKGFISQGEVDSKLAELPDSAEMGELFDPTIDDTPEPDGKAE